MGKGRNYSVVGAENISLGQYGSVFINDTALNTGNCVAIQFIEDTKFTTLTPESADFPGTSGGNGDAISSADDFPLGVIIFGRWTGIQLDSGAVIAYQG